MHREPGLNRPGTRAISIDCCGGSAGHRATTKMSWLRLLLSAGAFIFPCLLQLIAAQGTNNSINLIIPKAPVLEPWDKGSIAVQGTSQIAGNAVTAAIVTLGPCVYRQLHW